MSSKQLSQRQARWSQFLFCFNFKINYKPGSQCKANALTRRFQDLPANSNPYQDYIEQVMLKSKNLSTVQSIQILCWKDIRSIDAIEQDLKSAINNTYQKMDSKDLVAVINQIITDRIYHSCHYSLSNYSLKNKYFYYHGKLYLSIMKLLCLWVLQESHD